VTSQLYEWAEFFDFINSVPQPNSECILVCRNIKKFEKRWYRWRKWTV